MVLLAGSRAGREKAEVTLEGEKAPKPVETWVGHQGANKNDKLELTELAFHGEQGTFDADGWFTPSPSLPQTAGKEFEIKSVYKGRPDKFSFATAVQLDVAGGGPGNPGNPGAASAGGPGGTPLVNTSMTTAGNGVGTPQAKGGANGTDGSQGSAGTSGHAGSPGRANAAPGAVKDKFGVHAEIRPL